MPKWVKIYRLICLFNIGGLTVYLYRSTKCTYLVCSEPCLSVKIRTMPAKRKTVNLSHEQHLSIRIPPPCPIPFLLIYCRFAINYIRKATIQYIRPGQNFQGKKCETLRWKLGKNLTAHQF